MAHLHTTVGLDRVRPNDVALLLVARANVRLQRGGMLAINHESRLLE